MRTANRQSPTRTTPISERQEDARCPRCGGTRFWSLDRGRRRCARCRFDWTPGRLPLRLTEHQWTSLLRWFARGMSSAQIAQETGLERKRVLRALTVTREAIGTAQGMPAATVVPRGERPVVGISIERGQASAEIVPEPGADALRRIIRAREGAGSAHNPHVHYEAVVYRGRFYRLRAPERGTTPRAIIGELESFWAYLRQRLRGKGGIRQERLGLYLAEYVWRYNRRAQPLPSLVSELLTMLREPPGVAVGLSPGRKGPGHRG